MQNLIALIGLVAQLLPTLIAAIKAVEDAMPQAGQGAAKLEMVRGWCEAAYATVTGTTITFAQVWPALEATVKSIVTVKNALGEFKKG